MLYASSTHKGNIRAINEDSLFIPLDQTHRHHGYLMAVADGMGGHRAGEVASLMAIESLLSFLALPGQEQRMQDKPETVLYDAIALTNRKIWLLSRGSHELGGMGTTITAALCKTDRVIIGHVGDTRAYLFSAGQLTRVTRDHTLVQEMVEAGLLTQEDTVTHMQRHILTRALGVREREIADIYDCPWSAGDKLLLCSDGLTEHVREDEIQSLLAETADLPTACTTLENMALERGGIDNISVCMASNEEVAA